MFNASRTEPPGRDLQGDADDRERQVGHLCRLREQPADLAFRYACRAARDDDAGRPVEALGQRRRYRRIGGDRELRERAGVLDDEQGVGVDRAEAVGGDQRRGDGDPGDRAALPSASIDLAIGVFDYSPYSELPTDLRIRQLYEDEFTCVVRAAHPTVKRTLSLAQYCEVEHVQIAPRGNPGGYVDELLTRHGLRRRIVRARPYFVAGLAGRRD
jgi:hypothetical protein